MKRAQNRRFGRNLESCVGVREALISHGNREGGYRRLVIYNTERPNWETRELTELKFNRKSVNQFDSQIRKDIQSRVRNANQVVLVNIDILWIHPQLELCEGSNLGMLIVALNQN